MNFNVLAIIAFFAGFFVIVLGGGYGLLLVFGLILFLGGLLAPFFLAKPAKNKGENNDPKS